jgi:uncharacterized phiE125 gp8 family phage protein
MKTTIITASNVLAVTVAEVKNYCRLDLDITEDDNLLEMLIATSMARCTQETGRALLTTTYRMTVDLTVSGAENYPPLSNFTQTTSNKLKLNYPNFLSLVSVVATDADGDETTLSATNYKLNHTGVFSTIQILNAGDAESVAVTYTAGYGATSDDIPTAIKQWILLDVSTLYENREAVTTGSMSQVPYPFVCGLLDAYRVQY